VTGKYFGLLGMLLAFLLVVIGMTAKHYERMKELDLEMMKLNCTEIPNSSKPKKAVW
jgi:hypothetical protein